MNPRPTCDEVQALAPEVALGIASGDERALVLAHTKSCVDCRMAMEELSATADALLLLGPQHEPASGFETTVLSRMQVEKRSPSRLRSKLIAAALASLLVTGAGAYWITADDRKVASYYRSALDVANGKYFEVERLEDSSGARVGHVFAYEGEPSWVFLIFDPQLDHGSYTAELETTEGRTMTLGTFDIGGGDVTWGRDISVGLRDVGNVRVVNDNDEVVAQASFSSR